MKRGIIALVLVSFLILSTVGSMMVASGHSGLKSFIVSPIRDTTIAQYQISEPLVITSNVDFALLGATGVGTSSDPYKFESLEISDNGYCIQIQMTTAFFVISNCKLESSEFFPVILFDNVKNGRVEQCELTGGSNGLYLIQSQDSSIEENSFYDCWNGISLFSTSNSTFIDNRIHNNKNRGIIFDQSDYCFVLNNSIYSNFKHGIEILFDSHNNTIYGNSIGWNDVSGGYEVNAIDNGEDNSFDDEASIGNFWSDFNESETYQIQGTGGSLDTFAQILEDTVDPIIVPLVDTAIDVETSGNTLTWLVYDQFPESYVIVENEVETISAIWTGGNITIELDHLDVGIYAMTIVVYDGAGNSASDEVLVSVVSFILGGIGTELVMIASGITVASFVIIVLLVKKLS